METTNENETSKPVMLFGRDITKIPCFRQSMLYGIYGGIGFGVATFMLTSRPKRSIEIALGTYTSIALACWCYCRYKHVKEKYAINDIQVLLQQRSAGKKTEIHEAELKQKGKLVDA